MGDSSNILLETERLVLRRFTPDDLDALYDLYHDPEANQYLEEVSMTRDETRDELQWIIEGYEQEPGYGLWAVIHRASSNLIGRVGLLPWTIEGQHEVEIAYMLAKPYWGQGLTTEAARALVAYAFDTLRLSRLVAFIDPGNVASERVATKIGMTFEKAGDINGEHTLTYTINRLSLQEPV